MESRHIDVIEMDAASHTGVDDVREIIDAIRYAPVSARYKVYIIDEVHMLSTQAFNALLKTLEEPPPHVKFVFATTEIRKVPVTVLSRCQRFDLRRVEAAMLVAHLGGIAEKEGVEVEPEALALIARAAEGSVRDALSLLDQAIAHAAGSVRAEDVRADARPRRPRAHHRPVRALMKGDVAAALAELRAVRRRRRSGGRADRSRRVHAFRHPHEARAGGRRRRFAGRDRAHARPRASPRALSMRVLSRAWQMLLKGIAEVQAAATAARRRRHGAGAARLCGRPADAGRGDPLRSTMASGGAHGCGRRATAAGGRRPGQRRPRSAQAQRYRRAARRPARSRGAALRSAVAQSAPAGAPAAAARPRPAWPSALRRT